MAEYLPLLIIGGIIGGFTLSFLIAYFAVRKEQVVKDFERHMSGGEITKRLMKYGKPYWKDFILVFVIMLLSIGHNILSPLLAKLRSW